MIDLDAWWAEAHRVAKPRAAIVCTGSQPFTSRLIMSNIERFRYEWVWDKKTATGGQNSDSRPMKAHENIAIFSSSPNVYNPIMEEFSDDEIKRMRKKEAICLAPEIGGGENISSGWFAGKQKFPSSVIRINGVAPMSKEKKDGRHPTQKPVALFEYLIRTYTQPGDLVVDPFVGSGTAAIAARNTGRRFICGDLDASYVATARARLAEPYTISMFDTPPAQAETPTQREMFAKTENPAEAG